MNLFKKKPKSVEQESKIALKKEEKLQNQIENSKTNKTNFTQDFIKASKEFETTRIDEILSREKTWQKVALGSMLAAVIMAIAIMFLTPLKEVEPYLVRVDNNTGQTDIVTVLANAESDYGEEVAKFFASNYVRLVEGYDNYTIQASFSKALLFSNKDEQNRLNTKFSKPDAPHKIYGVNKRVEIQIDNVSFVAENLLQVRFTKNVVNTDGGVYSPQEGAVTPKIITSQGIATIGYDYVNVPEVDEIRLINPLGFTVYTYRVDEVINPTTATAVTAPIPTRAPTTDTPVTGGF